MPWVNGRYVADSDAPASWNTLPGQPYAPTDMPTPGFIGQSAARGAGQMVSYPGQLLYGEKQFDPGEAANWAGGVGLSGLAAGSAMPMRIMRGEEGLGMMVGRSALETNPTKYHTAMVLAKRGFDPETIRQITGYHPGKDLLMRREIPDYDASLSHAATYATPGPHMYMRMQDVLQHPELYRNYPFMKDIMVNIGGTRHGGGSFYDPKNNVIQISKEHAADPDEFLSTMLHEGSHVIQQHEGFASGTNPDWIMNETLKNMAPSQQALFMSLPQAMQDRIAFQLYLQEAGEVEARTVQARAKMTPGEFAAESPLRTEENIVPRDKQVMMADLSNWLNAIKPNITQPPYTAMPGQATAGSLLPPNTNPYVSAGSTLTSLAASGAEPPLGAPPIPSGAGPGPGVQAPAGMPLPPNLMDYSNMSPQDKARYLIPGGPLPDVQAPPGMPLPPELMDYGRPPIS